MLLKTARTVRNWAIAVLGLSSIPLLGGCGATYATPGRGADLKLVATRDEQTDVSINQTLAKKPLATLPCGIAAVRIQAKDYHSDSAETYGTGNYCVVTTRDVESAADLDRLRKLPMVAGLAPLSRLMLPQTLNTDLELRQGAAALHADMLLIYTIDTTFQVEDHMAPLTVVTLGLSPNMTAQIVTTESAVLMDTRNGYVYGYAEATEHGIQLTNGWMTEQAVNDSRKRTEAKAFKKLVDNLQQTWGGVVKELTAAPTTRQGPM